MRRSLAAALLLAAALPALGPSPLAAKGAAELLVGVRRIASPGVPGPLCVYGERASPAVVGGAGGETRLPVVAISMLGSGWVVAFGHGGYLDEAVLRTADTGRLLENAVEATAAGPGRPRVAVVGAAGAAAYLRGRGFAVDEVGLSGIAGHQVVVLGPWNESAAEVAALAQAVRQGMGLVVAATGWGWAQLNPERDLQLEFAGNRLLAAAGIQWANDWLEETDPGGGYAVPGLPSRLTAAAPALSAAEAQAAGTLVLTPAELGQVSRTLVANAACLPPDDTLFLPRLRAVTRSPVVPSPENPVMAEEVLDRVAVVMQTRELDALPPSEARAHPAARLFPGEVPAGAPREPATVLVDLARPDWHSSGRFAPPGEVITVRLGETDLGRGLGLRIGAHTDSLWGSQEGWTRMPDISRWWPLTAAETRVFSPYGGLVYVTVPRDAGPGTVAVGLEGSVEAPLYLAGASDAADWPRRRAAPAPWAEIGSGKMVVTVPSDLVRGLDDPAAVAATWDRVLDLDAELAGGPSPRLRAERFVTDQQIAYGYMHAGYPLMCFLDQAAHLVDVAHLRTEGNWGFFHEVGHNHQSADWTFEGTGEVTVNLFTLYTYEHLTGIPVLANERGSVAFVREQLAKVDWSRPDFAQWRADPFLALAMYAQLQHAFGWEAFRRVFAEYRDLPAAERPRDDDEKRDQWLLRFSRTVGRDLGPFFEAWGLPTSAAARAALADLPPWMPRDFPPGYALDPSPSPPPTATSIPTGTPPAPTATATATRPAAPALYLPWLGAR